MDRIPDYLLANWSLVVAAGLLGCVTLVVAVLLWRRSARGRLRRETRRYRVARGRRQSLEKEAESLTQKLQSLTAIAERIPEKKIDIWRGRLQDAESLLRIASDQELVAANRVRRIIIDEFPKVSHERLRRRCLPDDPLSR